MLRIATVAGEHGSFCLAQGEERIESPLLYVGGTRPNLDERASVVLALAEPVERAAGDAMAAMAVISDLRHAIDGCAPDDVIEALHRSHVALSRRLLQQNRANGGTRKVFLGLTCVVRCGDDLFITQVPPGQALIRQDSRLYAFPKLRSWLPTFQPSQTYDLPNPLGLREITEPQVYYSRAMPGDLLMVVSSPIAARLEPLQDEIRDAAGVEDIVDTVTDVCQRHAIVRGELGVVLV